MLPAVGLLPAESQWWFDTIDQHFSAQAKYIEALGFGQEVMRWNISRCSSGEKQRLSVLRMLSNCPRVLLLDEPTANLDSCNIARVEDLIHRYLSEHNAVAIWVSHDASQLERVSQQQCHLSGGKLKQVSSA